MNVFLSFLDWCRQLRIIALHGICTLNVYYKPPKLSRFPLMHRFSQTEINRCKAYQICNANHPDLMLLTLGKEPLYKYYNIRFKYVLNTKHAYFRKIAVSMFQDLSFNFRLKFDHVSKGRETSFVTVSYVVQWQFLIIIIR
jgi:hypothetical protein